MTEEANWIPITKEIEEKIALQAATFGLGHYEGVTVMQDGEVISSSFKYTPPPGLN